MKYVSTLMKVMPTACRLLRYDYGSPGQYRIYHNDPMFMDKQAFANSADQDQTAPKRAF